MNKLTIIQELWKRITSGGSNTPEFFNKLKAYSFYILLAIAAAYGLEYLEILQIPDKLDLILLPIGAWALGTGSTAATTVKDKAAAGLNDDAGDGPGPGGEPPKPPTRP